jgi:hypothetical protein
MGISIFARRAFLNVSPGQEFEPGRLPPRRGHIMRVSSMIRADQVAERLGARLNPTECYHGDVCIYVKPHVKSFEDFSFEGKSPYLDIVDGWALTPLADRHPNVGVIACSAADADTLRRVLPNKVTLIPQHHCNFERARRTREGVTRVGMIGTDRSFDHLPDGLARALAERGIELELFSTFFTRQDVVDFYQRIDVQIVWRPYPKRLANPLKLVNAASFGVPTIALDEPYFAEVRECYMGVCDARELLVALDKLRDDPYWFGKYTEGGRAVAERYHIDRIADLYRSLN